MSQTQSNSPLIGTGEREDCFLFATFRGEATPMTEQVYFVVSQDGRNWQALSGGEPVLTSTLGEKGVRDPYILRSHDGSKFFLLGTDLSINLTGNWRRAVTAGSRSILVWESADMVNWSSPRLVPLAPADAGCAWAPEAIYDPVAGDYLVFWASTTARDEFKKHRLWASRTRDFVTFSEPFIFIERANSVIDTDIVLENGTYYRFSKDEVTKGITLEVATDLAGPWRDVPEFSLKSLLGVEGPQCFPLRPASAGHKATWCLVLDHFARSAGYFAYVTTDLSQAQFTSTDEMNFPFKLRHGSVLTISPAEYDRLIAAYPI